jgi:hypothetical protein
MQWRIEVRDCFKRIRRHLSGLPSEGSMARASSVSVSFSIATSISISVLVGALGCGGSESSDGSGDSGVADSVAIDSGVDTHVAPDASPDAPIDTSDTTPPPSDAPPGTAQLRIANMLWFPTATNVRVCLVDSTTGKSTLIEPAGVTGGLAYQTVTGYLVAPTGSNFTVHLVDAAGDCSSPAIIASGAPLDAPIEDGKSYLLGIAREPGEGDYAMVRLSPDLPPPSGAGAGKTRAFDMLYSLSSVDVSIAWGTTPLVFPSLPPGNVPTSSTGGTPSPEGYVSDAGDVTSVDVTLTGGATIGHFPMGFFFTERNTYWVTGAPPGGPVPPQIVYCHDDLSSGPLTRCDTISAGP